MTSATVDSGTLTQTVGTPTPIAADKVMPALDNYCRQFIAMSPFLCLGTSDAEGRHDVSPRGDPPGFVKVLDDRTLFIPDRLGNRRVDSMHNILENPKVGILFLLPGVEETLRVNGRAELVQGSELLADAEGHGKTSGMGIIVRIEEVFFHCAKALKRSGLWDPATRIARQDFPSYGQIVRDQRLPEKDVEAVQAVIDADYKTRLY